MVPATPNWGQQRCRLSTPPPPAPRITTTESAFSQQGCYHDVARVGVGVEKAVEEYHAPESVEDLPSPREN